MTEPWVWALVLTAVALLHGVATGATMAAGRDGRVRHRRTEGRGALRGIAVMAGLWVPLAVIAAFDAASDPERLAAYTAGMAGMAVVYGPVAAVVVVAFVLARVTSWQVRACVNSVVLGGVAFARPALAWAGVVLGAWWARDLAVTVVMVAAVVVALQVPRVLSWRWYQRPRAGSGRAELRH